MDRKLITKILATMLVFTLTFANIALLGIYAQETLAASVELEEQDVAVDNANIEFDAYFQEEGEQKHFKDIDVTTNDDILYLSIKVSDGYLTNATIRLEDANFSLVDTEEELEFIQTIDTETNTITLNQITKGESVILEVPIIMNTDSDFNVDYINKVSNVILEGRYVNNDGDYISISKTIKVSATITAEAEANLEAEISKYVQFDINGERGVILQTTIKSNIIGNVLPVKQSEIEIEIPEINGTEPTSVVISSASTEATNGEGAKTFVQNEDYTYENGKIILTINNEEKENGTISWLKDVQDEIILTCVYSEEAIVAIANVNLNINSNLTLYNNESNIVSASISETLSLNEQIGDIMTYGIYTNEESLQKGYMLVAGASNTEYSEIWTANIGSRDLVDSVVLENEVSYIDANQNEYPAEPLYTYTKITSENFLGILGEEGYINIYDESGNIITTLNKDNLEYTYENEINYIRIETSKPVSEGMLNIENGRAIKALEYSKAQEELFTGIKTEINGNVVLGGASILSGSQSAEMTLVEPTTQAELTLSKNDISTVVTTEGVEIRVTLKTTDASTVLYKNPVIEIVFPSYVTSVAAENVRLLYEDELSLSSATMYTNANGNKVIRVTLSGEETKFNDNAQAEGATLIMKADITVDELTPSRTENIEMYVSNEMSGEVITVLTPINFVAPVGMVTINQISNYNDNGETVTSISGKAEVGEIETEATARQATVNMTIINNYNYNCENLVIVGRTPFEGNKTVISGQDLGSTFTAKIATTIQAVTGVNNDQITVYYSSNGEATKDLTDTQNGWTTDPNSLTEIKSFMIVLNNYTLNTGETISFSYNILIPEGLTHDESTYGTFAVYYNRQEESSTGIQTYSTLANVNAVTESTESTPVGLSTGEGPNLSVELVANVDNNSEVTPDTIITYTATITNQAESVAENVNLTLTVPSQAYFINEDGSRLSGTVTISVGEIAAQSNETITFQIKVGPYAETDEDIEIDPKYADDFDSVEIDINDLESLEDYYENSLGHPVYEEGENSPEEFYYQYLLKVAEYCVEENIELNSTYFDSDTDYEMYLQALEEYTSGLTNDAESNIIRIQVTAQVEGYDDTFTSNQLVNTIIPSGDNVSIDITTISTVSGQLLAGQTVGYLTTIKSNSSTTLSNVVVTCVLPEGYTYESSNNNGEYNSDTRTITWTFAEFTNQKTVTFNCTVDELPEGETSRELPITVNVTCDESGSVFTGNTYIMTAVREGISIAQTSNISDGYISSGEEITYAIAITNTGITSSSVQITDYLPTGLTFVKAYYTQNGGTKNITNSSGSSVKISLTVNGGETVTVYLTAKADTIAEDATLEVTNKVSLSSGTIDEIWANELTHTILGANVTVDDDGNLSGNTSGSTTYRISGVAWLDANGDGKRDDTEELLSGIKVYLLDSTSNEVISTSLTNSSGTYTFTRVSSGKYVVAFEYDTTQYDVTTYQAEGVDSSVDSDVINVELTINGTTATYAATNTISVSSNTYNVDLGLVESQKFDLELTKGVSLIQVSNSSGTSNYTFDNTDLAKIEIPGKYMSGSVVAITYTFTIKNTGAVAGYAKKIVDYLPSDLDFSSTLNPEWYQDTDGNLYNTSLESRLINPGEEVELTLVLTKTMTDENTGVTNNTAEIYEASNDEGISDIDSTPGNKATGEDDFGSADVIITVKTGGAVVYVGIVIAVLAVFAVRSICNKEKSAYKGLEGKEGKYDE